jgi:predicted O-methyltransferase YrrM
MHILSRVHGYACRRIDAISRSAKRRRRHPEFDRFTKGAEIRTAICEPLKCPIGQDIERRRLQLSNDKRLLVDIGRAELGLSPSELGLSDDGETMEGCVSVSRPSKDGELLYNLVALSRPRTCLELGTNIGISSAYIAAGIMTAGAGTLLTLEASPVRASLARQFHADLKLPALQCRTGLFSDTLLESLKLLGSAEFVFIDGHHQYEATLNYWNLIAPFCPPGALIVLDDTRWSDGMIRAWRELQLDKRFGGVVDLGWLGICVVGNGPGPYVDASHFY